jgi:hypothetical protein
MRGTSSGRTSSGGGPVGGSTGALTSGFYASLSQETCVLVCCGVRASALLFYAL